jgi:hypothetical protein
MKNFFKKNSKQDGITLILTVMMVSGIAVITSTVAFFVVQEIRNSRTSRLSEPAIIAAETAGEQGIYLFKHGSPIPNCGSANYTGTDGTSTASADTLLKKCIASQPVSFSFNNSQPLTLFLYDPINVNGNTCLEDDAVCPADGNGSGNQLYSQFILDYRSGTNNIEVDIVTLDGVAYVADDLVGPGTLQTYNIDRNILGSNDERLMITLTPSASSTEPSTVQISTAGLWTGLPDYQTVDASGCRSPNSITDCDTGSSEVTKRRINITLPR